MTKKSLYHPNFIEYMNKMITHPNYQGLAISFKKDTTPVWVAPKKTSNNIGILREQWADSKARELGFENSSKKYSDTMFALHPTKIKVCQFCGESMDLHFVYPTKITVKYFEKNFNYVFNRYDTINDIIAQLPQYEGDIRTYLIEKAGLSRTFINKTTSEIINAAEYQCRMKGKRILSPGAMSNFPDRFDGFHSYNLCCRKEKDKGRHDVNMATYSKDRRAYEYWSDGNIVAANQLMGNSEIFKGQSADHIGPISLGFIHDPVNLQPMSRNENSAKRDRLVKEDLEKLIEIEKSENITVVSIFSDLIWKYIKDDYNPKTCTSKLEWYKDILKQNMMNFMESLWVLRDTNNRVTIDKFLENYHFTPKYEKYFKYKYTFDENGNILSKVERNVTDSSKDEFDRFMRVSLTSIDDFHKKSLENRRLKANLSTEVLDSLRQLQTNIQSKNFSSEHLIIEWNRYLCSIQKDLLIKVKQQNL